VTGGGASPVSGGASGVAGGGGVSMELAPQAPRTDANRVPSRANEKRLEQLKGSST